MLVTVFHFDLFSVGKAGFIGVDVFFVISGFLITSIIVRDLRAGNFAMGHFLYRRARRLYPAMVATLTFLPFILSGSVTVLASLDFLGFGLPPGSPSLGELVNQGKNNLTAPWLAMTGFVVLGGMLTLLIFVGEAVRDAFDPRKLPGGGR